MLWGEKTGVADFFHASMCRAPRLSGETVRVQPVPGEQAAGDTQRSSEGLAGECSL